METKKLYIHVITSGILLVVATLFVVIAIKGFQSEGDADIKDIVFVLVGTLLFMASMVNILYIVYKELIGKSII